MTLTLVPDLPADPTPNFSAPGIPVEGTTGGAAPVGEHPSLMLLSADEDTVVALEMDLRGGWTSRATPSLTHWQVTFTCTRRDFVDDTALESVPVATLGLTVVNPSAGDPVEDLDVVDQDAAELGEMLFVGSERTAGFADIAGGGCDPVLLIDTYEVEPGWRGTDLTPLLALRTLGAFAHLGVGVAALCAAPIAEEMSREDRERVAAKIADMWAKAGFVEIATPNYDGLDNTVMVANLDWLAIESTIEGLVGDSPVLAVAAHY